MSAYPTIIDCISISTYSTLSEIEIAWKKLENTGIAMAFQKYEWCKTWVEHMAPAVGASPLIVCGRDVAGEVVFILPFQKREIGKVRVLEWLGQQSGTACGGLYTDSFCSETGQNWFNKNFRNVLNLLGHLEALNLRHMPKTILGRLNPLAILHQSPSANASFVLNLQKQYEVILQAKRSSRSISKMRRRDERLEQSGALTFDILSGDAADSALQLGLLHKNLQLKKAGVASVFDHHDIEFYRQVLRADKKLLRVFRLQLNGNTLATMVGATADTNFWLLISALAPDIDLQFSPGDYLLRRTISICCAEGISIYDFSLGEQSYKQLWADERVLYFNSIRALNYRGQLFAVSNRLTEAVKRFAKHNTRIREFYYEARQRLRGKKN